MIAVFAINQSIFIDIIDIDVQILYKLLCLFIKLIGDMFMPFINTCIFNSSSKGLNTKNKIQDTVLQKNVVNKT